MKIAGSVERLPQNNAVADRRLRAHAFFRWTDFAGDHMQWLNLLWVLPLFQWWRFVKKGQAEQGSTRGS